MFEPGTILRLREPQSTKDNPYPYDRVYVVGQSVIQRTYGDPNSPWAGPDATGYILRPDGEAFGPVVDKPYGEIMELYEIEEYPMNPITGEPLVPEANQRGLPTPEQVFAQMAKPDPSPRQRTPVVQDDYKSPEQALRTRKERKDD